MLTPRRWRSGCGTTRGAKRFDCASRATSSASSGDKREHTIARHLCEFGGQQGAHHRAPPTARHRHGTEIPSNRNDNGRNHCHIRQLVTARLTRPPRTLQDNPSMSHLSMRCRHGRRCPPVKPARRGEASPRGHAPRVAGPTACPLRGSPTVLRADRPDHQDDPETWESRRKREQT